MLKWTKWTITDTEQTPEYPDITTRDSSDWRQPYGVQEEEEEEEYNFEGIA